MYSRPFDKGKDKIKPKFVKKNSYILGYFMSIVALKKISTFNSRKKMYCKNTLNHYLS